MKDYIDIKPDFTLDRDIDNSAPTGKENVFTDLKNYIPDQGSIVTRSGVSGFGFTSEIYNPLTDPNLLVWLRGETTATLDDCEIQGPDFMDNIGPASASSTNFWEGSASAYIDTKTPGVTERLERAVIGLPTNFPACDNEDGYMLTFYLKLDWWPTLADNNVHLIEKNGTPGGSDIMGAFASSIVRNDADTAPVLQFVPYDKNGASTEFRGTLSMYSSYHIGLWVSDSLQLAGMRIHDVVSGGTYNKTFPCNGTSYDRSVGKKIIVGYSKLRGWIDDIMFFDSAPSTEGLIYAKIDSIRERNE